MKILAFTTLYPNSIMPNHGTFVANRMVAIAKSHEVVVVAPVPYFPKIRLRTKWSCFGNVPFEETIRGIKVFHPRYLVIPGIFRSLHGLSMFFGALDAVCRLNAHHGFDLIDAHFVYPDSFAAVLLGKLLKKKTVVTARGTDINRSTSSFLMRQLIKYALNNCNMIISVSAALKEKMISLGIPGEKIKVVQNGVDKNVFFSIPTEQARKELGLPYDKRIILSAGHLLEAKGFQHVINSLSLSGRRDVLFYIIGEGPYRKELERLIKKLCLERQVLLVGEKKHGELRKWYSAADLFCFTSLSEGRPNVVPEALSCGTPVLSMNRWGLSECITKERGILLDTYSSETIARNIETALKTPWDRRTIALSMKKYTWDDTADKVAETYKKVLEGAAQ